MSPTAPLRHRIADAVLSRDAHTRLRTGMALLALGMMAASSLVMLMLAARGLAHPTWVPVWAAVSVGGVLLMALLIRSGVSRRWADPSLTLAQMLFTATSGAVAYVIAGESRSVVPAVLAAILFFGTVGLSTRQILGVGLYMVAAFGAAVMFTQWNNRLHDQAYDLGLAYIGMEAIVLVITATMAVQFQRLRNRLREQKAELTRALDEIRELAMRDALTGLINRRQMKELIDLEHARRSPEQRPVLALIDLDHFKRVNDRHGHAAGDRALQAAAQAALSGLRQSDLLARWGGEEFVLMLTDTRLADAPPILERLRQRVAELRLTGDEGAPFQLTVSIGYAQQRAGESPANTLQRADSALYRAKHEGRNRVAAAAPHAMDDEAGGPSARPRPAPESRPSSIRPEAEIEADIAA